MSETCTALHSPSRAVLSHGPLVPRPRAEMPRPIQDVSTDHLVLKASLGLGENAPNGCDQPIEFDRVGVELVAARGEGIFALTGERMRGQSYDRDVASLRIALEPPVASQPSTTGISRSIRIMSGRSPLWQL